MKRNMLILLLLLSGHCLGYAQQLVSGTVTDGHHPIAGANVFVKGTTDGCLTDSLGHFSFSTLKADSTQLMVTCIGYDNAERNWQKGQGPLAIRLYERTTTIDEVVVTGCNTVSAIRSCAWRLTTSATPVCRSSVKDVILPTVTA